MSSGSGAMGSYQEGKAQQSIYNRGAYQALEEAQIRMDASRKETKQLTSQQRALYAKAGVDISSGSPLMIMSDTAAQGELQTQRIKWQGVDQYKMLRYYARMARTAGNASSTTQGAAAGITVASMIAGGIGGAAAGAAAGTGATAGAFQGAMSAGSGGGGAGQGWGSFIQAMAPKQNYGLGTVKSPYSGRYYNQ